MAKLSCFNSLRCAAVVCLYEQHNLLRYNWGPGPGSYQECGFWHCVIHAMSLLSHAVILVCCITAIYFTEERKGRCGKATRALSCLSVKHGFFFSFAKVNKQKSDMMKDIFKLKWKSWSGRLPAFSGSLKLNLWTLLWTVSTKLKLCFSPLA